MTDANGRSVRELLLSALSGSDGHNVLGQSDASGAASDPDLTTTALDLRRERRMAEVSVVALAKAMGITRQSVWLIENGQLPLTPARITAYRHALTSLIEEVA